MPFSVKPLAGQQAEAIEIRGLTAADIADPTVRKQLNELWIQHGLIVFRGMEGAATHVALSEVFGPCQTHPIKQSNTPVDHPELTNVEYEPGGPNGMVYSVNGQELGAWLPLHSDLIYVDKVNHGGILRPMQIPKTGGATRFLDKIVAYDTLPERLKARIEGLEVIYRFDINIENMKFAADAVELKFLGFKFQDIQSRLHLYPRSIHPLVYSQAETGRKMLNLSPWFAEEIVGLPPEEGDALLRELCSHMLRHPAIYDHPWQEGDLVLWDNWRLLHGGAGVPRNERRWVQRTTIAGDYALGRLETETAGAGELRTVEV